MGIEYKSRAYIDRCQENKIDSFINKFELFIGSIKPNCAKAGERSVSNFDMTKGIRDPNIEVVNCCLGLKNIADKQITNTQEGCTLVIGIPHNLCSPCGNGVCDVKYEDRCNCSEDCKE